MKRSVLSDKELLQAYHQAQKLNLDKEFINMLKEEIQLRKLSEKSKKPLSF
ncbi:sporulation histidine kinase inhibitor Sda [Domibacillus iocasae]|uniref:sporulation histidine kinase inhibitor Sda n=1 Tax=Domibacillus iocasae TaxID=1714016 RepID=UPI0009F6E49B|nr:sporulation histidine kinase inhibitor Sda [Domibacillus iocasae]